MFPTWLIRFSTAAFLLLGASTFLGSCGSEIGDVSEGLAATSRILPTPRGSYIDVAWLPGNEIAFLYAPIQASYDFRDYAIAIYKMSTQAWEILRFPRVSTTKCNWVGFSNLSRLPNGALGFLETCSDPSVPGLNVTILFWDPVTETTQVIQSSAETNIRGAFSFAPDMSEWVQDDGNGAGLDNRLFLLSRNGQAHNLVADFQRASRPSWSPDGRAIAFMGTKDYPGGKSGDLKQLPQIEALARYPWDLYLMDPEGASVRLLLSGIDGGGAAWLPHSPVLSLSARYRGEDGLWLLNPATGARLQLWSFKKDPYFYAYDWSPDEKHIVMLQCKGSDCGSETHPLILDVPDDVVRLP